MGGLQRDLGARTDALDRIGEEEEGEIAKGSPRLLAFVGSRLDAVPFAETRSPGVGNRSVLDSLHL